MATNVIRPRISEVLPPAFYDVWRAAKTPRILNIVCKGGRGSGKSSDIALILAIMLVQYPVNGLGIRKIDNTIELSIFEQMKWAISMLGMEPYFRINKSPMRITYLPRGNYMVFRGAQEPERIKSLKSAKFPFSLLWIEESMEFKSEEEVTTITNSLLRGELGDNQFYKFFYSYNPPKRRQNWVNKKYNSVNQPRNTFVHHSTYKDNPFVAPEFIEEAEATKLYQPLRYRWEYLGEAIGSGVVPFDNVHFREIPDNELARFDNIRQGEDFGYAVDPYAFVRWHYDKKRRTIYAMDEYYGVKISNRDSAEWIKVQGYERKETIADSAEPKSIDEQRGYGVKVSGAKKGPDSVEYGEKWLDDLEAIVIDPARTPNLATEFENIDFEMDKDGNPKAKLEDKNNHCITGDTIVNTESGSFPIRELVGARGNAWAFNEATEQAEIAPFYDVRKTREQAEIVELETEDGRMLQLTADHLVLTRHGWKEAGRLTPADEIVTLAADNAPGVNYTKVKAVRSAGVADVYNMEVESRHNFSVCGGLIIHNCIDATRYAFERDMKADGVSVLKPKG